MMEIRSLLPEKKPIKDYTVDEVLLMIFGILGPMPILSIGNYTVFSYLMLLTVAWNLFYLLAVRRGFVIPQKTWLLPILIFLEAAIGIVLCVKGTMPQVWKDGETTRMVWELMHILFFLVYASRERWQYVKYYIKGVYLSALIQMGWCLGQYAYYVITKTSLNAKVFSELLHMNGFNGELGDGVLDQVNGVLLTGFCWHPSNMAPLLCIIYLFSKSWPVKAVALMVAAMCGNRTALLGVGVCMGCECLVYFYKQKGQFPVRRFYAFLAAGILLFGGLYCVVFEHALIERVVTTLQYYIEKTSMDDGSTSIHIQYWTCFPQAAELASLWQFLYGFGADCSGYVASTLLGAYPGQKWVMECDYMNIFWSYGLVGFVLRYVWYVQQGIMASRKRRGLWILFAAIAVMGVFYNVLYNWMIIFLYSIFVLNTGDVEENVWS